MREHNQSLYNRRRGPKYPLPNNNNNNNKYPNQYVAATETPYYTIDNTEDIYGTTLSAAERCYIDPWDLENYDYVRRRLDSSSTPSSYYSISLPSSSINDDISHTIQHNRTLTSCDHVTTCQFCPYCDSSYCEDNIYGLAQNSPHLDIVDSKESIYGYKFVAGNMSPIAFPDKDSALQKLEFPSPPSHSIYDYCNSFDKYRECNECSSIYHKYAGNDDKVSSLYDESGYMLDYIFDCNSSTLRRQNRNYSPLGNGIYSQKFGLSKKGLLQIDYSCSWTDLDRAIGRNY